MKENLVVFAVSAFWHGIYPTYYLVFGLYAFLKNAQADFYRGWYLFKAIPEPVRKFIGWIQT